MEAAPRPPFAPFRYISLVEQREGPQRYARGRVLQRRVATALRIDAAQAAHHRDVLLAVSFPRHRVTDDARGSLEAPKDLAGLGVERLELAVHDDGEHEITPRIHGR